MPKTDSHEMSVAKFQFDNYIEDCAATMERFDFLILSQYIQEKLEQAVKDNSAAA